MRLTSLTRGEGDKGFVVETSTGTILADKVVVATGPFQRPIIPPLVPDTAGLVQIHSSGYRNPAQLPDGGVLVIGAGSSGVQIAAELQKAGRQVYLSVGPHDRPPRRYRGKDFCWWLGVLGLWDLKASRPGLEHVTIAVSGADGGHTVDFRKLGNSGITLVGMTDRFVDGKILFADDLPRNVLNGDANLLSMLDAADAYIRDNGLDFPEEPEARLKQPDPACLVHPLRELDLKAAGVTSIIWATGYALDFSWIKLDIFDDKGRPKHSQGVAEVPGLYFIGLAWLTRRASPFIWGVWHDAASIAAHIAGRS